MSLQRRHIQNIDRQWQDVNDRETCLRARSCIFKRAIVIVSPWFVGPAQHGSKGSEGLGS